VVTQFLVRESQKKSNIVHVAPDLGSCTRNYLRLRRRPGLFCFRHTGLNWQDAATERRSLTKERATGAIACTMLAAGIANVLIPGRRSRGWILARVTGIARTPILLFADHPLNGQPGRRAYR
jgi:hypothetical protein